MKTLRIIYIITFTITALMFVSAPLLVMSGCGTTPTDTLYKVEATTITTVDAAMLAWADYVRSHPETPQSQRKAVKSAYQEYYGAQLVVAAAVATGQTPNTANVLALQTKLIVIVKGYLK